jgi:hypothetical protein
MLKKLLTIVLPLALPFLLYWGYVVLAKWRARKTGGDPDIPWPWAVLALSGMLLMVATLMSYRFVFSEPGAAGTRVVPERYIDGEIRDSEIEPGPDS